MQQVLQKKVMNRNDTQIEHNFDLKIIKGSKSILEFEKDWDDLFARVVDAPPYLSRPWVSAFIRDGKIRGTPIFILAFCAGKLVAILPLAIRKCLGVKMAEPIGIEEAAYIGILLDMKYTSVIGSIIDLIASEKIYDAYINTSVSTDDASANNLIMAFAQKGYNCRQKYKNPCHYIQLNCSFDQYLLKSMSSRSRHTLHRKRRRLLRGAEVEVQYYFGEEITREIIDRILVVQQDSWMKRRGVALLEQRFHREFLLAMAQADLGCLWLMTVNGDDAAFQYSFTVHDKLYFRSTAFKLRYKSLSIGQSLMMSAIKDACNDNVRLIDFGPGDAEYKRFWCTNHYDVNRFVAGKGPKGRLILYCYSIVWLLAENKHLLSFYRRAKALIRKLNK